MFIFVWKTFYISNYHVLNTVYVERFWHTLFNICTCISSDLYFSCRLSTFVFLLVHYHSNSVIFENCDIFKLVYYIILISWSVEPGIDILSNLRLLKYWSEVKKNNMAPKYCPPPPFFLLESGFNKLWQQISNYSYILFLLYEGTKYYGHNILTHSIVIAISEKVQIIATVFHITLR